MTALANCYLCVVTTTLADIVGKRFVVGIQHAKEQLANVRRLLTGVVLRNQHLAQEEICKVLIAQVYCRASSVVPKLVYDLQACVGNAFLHAFIDATDLCDSHSCSSSS